MGLLDRCVEKMECDGMERLTEVFEDGQHGVAGCGKNCKYKYRYCDTNVCPTLDEVVEKLGKYEDTGITPEQMHEINEMYRDLATELSKYKKAEEELAEREG